MIAVSGTQTDVSGGPCMQISVLSTATGVGGGAFFVPLFNLLVNFGEQRQTCTSTSPAVQHMQGGYKQTGTPGYPRRCLGPHADVEDAGAISAAVIAMGSLAGVSVALLARHPHFCDQPLIDFDLALVLLPVVLLGVSVGAFAWASPSACRAC